MNDIAEKFKINLNQNLWGMAVSYAALGVAEHFGLKALFWMSGFVSFMLSLSFVSTTLYYTINYCKNKAAKWKKAT